MAHYKWQNTMYPAPTGPIKAGVYSGDTSIHSTDVLTGSSTTTFAYLDSNVVMSPVSSWSANNTSRVDVELRTDWSVTFDNKNNMTVTISVTLVRQERADKNGNPKGNSATPLGRNTWYYPNQDVFNKRNPWANYIAHAWDGDINEAKVLLSNVFLGTQTFTIAPGQEANRSSIFVYNKTPTTNPKSTGDWMNMGVHFINDMPPDYRPGAILVNGVWESHNRSDGESHILCSSRWSEMRTDNGHSENDNPPSIRMGNRWTDQLLLGKEN